MFTLSLLGTALATALCLRLLLRWRHRLPIDLPNWRSLHSAAIPRIGGIGIALGTLAGIAATRMVEARSPDPAIAAALACAVMLFLLSLRDDWHPLPIPWRLAGHVVVTGTLCWFLEPPLLIPLLIALVWMTNLYNFMDGADGLAGGMAIFGFGGYGWIALQSAPDLAWTSLTLAAAAAGFLVFNFAPAKIFLGDCGAIPLGFLAGALGLIGWQAGTWPGWFPVWVFSPFIADSTLTLLARIRRGEKFWLAHHEHCYQRLVRMGWSHRRVALSYYGSMCLSVIMASGAMRSSPALSISLMTFSLIAYLCVFRWVTLQWRRHQSRESAVASYCKRC